MAEDDKRGAPSRIPFCCLSNPDDGMLTFFEDDPGEKPAPASVSIESPVNGGRGVAAALV
jgi:hypothetical protein